MIKIALFVGVVIVGWLIISQPDTSGPIVGEVIKYGAVLVQEWVTALLEFLGKVTSLLSST